MPYFFETRALKPLNGTQSSERRLSAALGDLPFIKITTTASRDATWCRPKKKQQQHHHAMRPIARLERKHNHHHAIH
jgi:hypothetical protein